MKPGLAIVLSVLASACLPAAAAGFGQSPLPEVGARGAPELEGGQLLHVRLKPRVEARGAQVTLGDLASMHSTDLQLLRRAMAIPMGRAPEPGTTLAVRSDRIWQWVAPRLGVRSDKVVFEGAGSVEVLAAGVVAAQSGGPGAMQALVPNKPDEAQPAPAANAAVARAVQRGDWATLTSQSGPIALESRVEVLEDGAVGHLVRVRMPNASSAVQARVSGPGRLEMQP